MKNCKGCAMIVAMMMVAVAVACVLPATGDSDATTDEVTTGTIKVYYYSDSAWSTKTVEAFDMYQAITTANTGTDALGYTLTFADGATSWKKTSGTEPYTYEEPNENYGKITAVNGSSTFSVFVYSGGSWTVANPALGWYRPFTDYAALVTFPNEQWQSGATAGSSNIAIVPGSISMPAGATGMLGLTNVGTGTKATYVFELKDSTGTVSPTTWPVVTYYNDDDEDWNSGTLTSSMLSDGVKISGYGSDAFLALKNALGDANATGQEIQSVLNVNPDETTYYTYYSWLDKVLNKGTESEFGTNYSIYRYWNSGNCPNCDMKFTLGYYSKLIGAPNSLPLASCPCEIDPNTGVCHTGCQCTTSDIVYMTYKSSMYTW